MYRFLISLDLPDLEPSVHAPTVIFGVESCSSELVHKI